MKAWLKGGMIGVLIGIPISIFMAISAYSSYLKGFGERQWLTYDLTGMILISIVASALIGILIALIISKETRKKGILSVIGGIIGLAAGIYLGLIFCFERCSGLTRFILSPIGSLLELLHQSELMLSIITWFTWFILGAIIANLIGLLFKKKK